MKHLFLTFCFAFHSLYMLAQVSNGGLPYSFTHPTIVQPLTANIDMPLVDVAALQAQDALTDSKDQPYRFGAELPTNITLNNAGQWQTLDNGARLWRVAIRSKDARYINLQFNEYQLPQGARLYVYNPTHTTVLGAFTAHNNKPNGKFATALVRGSICIVEYYEPANVAQQGIISINKVIHAYRGFGSLRDYGDSGSCNNNANCPIAADWQNEKRSVALILSGGFRSCSGAMINNVRQDCKPYFLTANHCLDSDVENWVFVFNYESPGCTNQDAPTNQSISGCTLKARLADSDFLLLELDEIPPADYNVFYSGFNASPDAATSTVCIHHPAGDIKKITFNTDPPTVDGFGGSGNTHWHIADWEDGTTEPGSSGSPLFNQNHQIIGQLHGGDAYCEYNFDDYFGGLWYSWNTGNTAAKRVKDWLDPDNTGTLSLGGRACSISLYALEAAINLNANSLPATLCTGQNANPQITFTNNGNDTIVYLALKVTLNGQMLYTYPWTGSLPYTATTNINLPPITPVLGINNVQIKIQQINGTNADAITTNNTINTTFNVVDGQNVTVQLSTDNNPNETSFQIVDDAGNIVYQQNNFLIPNTNNTFNYCLAFGCYTFKLFDAWGDGITNGTYQITLPDGTIVGTGNGNFGNQTELVFCNQNNVSANFGADAQQICINQQVTYTPIVSPNTTSVQWQFTNGEPAITDWLLPTQTVTVNYPQAGTYAVQLIAKNNFDADTITQNSYVTVRNLPEISFNATQPTLANADGRIEATITTTGNYTLLWSNGNTTNVLDNQPKGDYTLTATDEIGCTKSANISLQPNINSPDGVVITPVPAANLLYIYNNNPPTTPVNITLYNVAGQMIGNANLTTGNNTLPLYNIGTPSGVYVARIKVANKQRQQKILWIND
jgi:lysyl endopeptidase